jgi:hypothetical protein
MVLPVVVRTVVTSVFTRNVAQGTRPVRPADSEEVILANNLEEPAGTVERIIAEKRHLFGDDQGRETNLSLRGEALRNARSAKVWAEAEVARARQIATRLRSSPGYLSTAHCTAEQRAVLEAYAPRLRSVVIMMNNVEHLTELRPGAFRYVASGLGRWCVRHPKISMAGVTAIGIGVGVGVGVALGFAGTGVGIPIAVGCVL